LQGKGLYLERGFAIALALLLSLIALARIFGSTFPGSSLAPSFIDPVFDY
jgi:hypothetical protein